MRICYYNMTQVVDTLLLLLLKYGIDSVLVSETPWWFQEIMSTSNKINFWGGSFIHAGLLITKLLPPLNCSLPWMPSQVGNAFTVELNLKSN